MATKTTKFTLMQLFFATTNFSEFSINVLAKSQKFIAWISPLFFSLSAK